MGTLFSSHLSKANEVFLLVKEEQLEPCRKGLSVDGKKTTGKMNIIASPGKEDYDMCIIAVKSYDVGSVIQELEKNCGVPPGFPLVLPQNGLKHLGLLENSSFDSVLMTVTYGATSKSPCCIETGGEGVIKVANFQGPEENAEMVTRAFSNVGFRVERNADAGKIVWEKAGINCLINPITALLEVKNGRLLELEETKMLMKKLAIEVEKVSRSIDIELDDIYGKAKEVCRKTRKNRSSMLQDIINGRRTEICSLNGTVSKIGKMNGIPAHYNGYLSDLVLAKSSKMEDCD